MILAYSILQRLQYFRAQIPHELLVAKDIRNWNSQSERAFDAIHCFSLN